MQQFDKSFYDLMSDFSDIEKDCLYIMTFDITHYEKIANTLHRMRRRCNEELTKYCCTKLKALYYNIKRELVQIDETFTVGPCKLADEKTLIRDINTFKKAKTIKPLIYTNMCDPEWTYGMVMTTVYKTLDKCTTLDDLIHFVRTRCCKLDKPNIDSIEQLIIPTTVTVRCFKDNNNIFKSKTFDFVDVYVPLITYEYTRREMVDVIKTHKTAIDKLVCSRVKEELKKYGTPINFLRLTDIIFTSDSGLLYKFSLKTVDDE